jgi:hypothetical protein
MGPAPEAAHPWINRARGAITNHGELLAELRVHHRQGAIAHAQALLWLHAILPWMSASMDRHRNRDVGADEADQADDDLRGRLERGQLASRPPSQHVSTEPGTVQSAADWTEFAGCCLGP